MGVVPAHEQIIARIPDARGPESTRTEPGSDLDGAVASDPRSATAGGHDGDVARAVGEVGALGREHEPVDEAVWTYGEVRAVLDGRADQRQCVEHLTVRGEVHEEPVFVVRPRIRVEAWQRHLTRSPGTDDESRRLVVAGGPHCAV